MGVILYMNCYMLWQFSMSAKWADLLLKMTNNNNNNYNYYRYNELVKDEETDDDDDDGDGTPNAPADTRLCRMCLKATGNTADPSL